MLRPEIGSQVGGVFGRHEGEQKFRAEVELVVADCRPVDFHDPIKVIHDFA